MEAAVPEMKGHSVTSLVHKLFSVVLLYLFSFFGFYCSSSVGILVRLPMSVF